MAESPHLVAETPDAESPDLVAEPPDADEGNASSMSGYVLKQSPFRLRLGQFQRRFVHIAAGELHWWESEEAAEEHGFPGSTGSVNFASCDCEIVEDERSSTKFFVRPREEWGWKGQRLTVADRERTLVFDARGSPFCRVQWVSAIHLAIASQEVQRASNKALLSLEDFLADGAPQTPGTTGSQGPQRRRLSIYDEAGVKISVSRSLRGGHKTPSFDKIYHTDTANLFVGDIYARNSAEVIRGNDIVRVVDCLEPGAFADIERCKFEGVEYMDLPIAFWEECSGARTEAGICRIMAPLLGYVSENLQSGSSVLIHCYAGAHRGGTAGIACLMHELGLSEEDATSLAKSRRGCIEPFSQMQKLLGRLHLARKEVLSTAIEAARKQGFIEAAAEVFAEALQDDSAEGRD